MSKDTIIEFKTPAEEPDPSHDTQNKLLAGRLGKPPANHIGYSVTKRRFTTVLTGLMLLFVGHLVHASNLGVNDEAALANQKVGEGVFLIDIGDAKKLNFCLGVIQGAYKGMKDRGVEPDFVSVFIGPSVKYLSTSPSAETEQAVGGVLMEIESNVEALAALGVRQEVCAVATSVFGVDNKSDTARHGPCG